ncbi:MAG: hypothetical protein M1819_001756 [Sarea resinae]|nr:MAG: hypothetical protein M1819_001756 [Sarea resinae]
MADDSHFLGSRQDEMIDTDHGDSDAGKDVIDGPASRGRRRLSQAASGSPTLFHRVKHNRSILSLAVSDQHIFAGTQGGEILVWSLETYELISTVFAHRGSVLCLCLSPENKLLFSSAGDAIINVWCAKNLNRLYSIYSTYDVGDVFCVAYSAALDTAYFGAQNTSIQWYDLKQKDSRPAPNPVSHPSFRNHRFFDSKGPGGISTPRPASSGEAGLRAQGGKDLEIDKENIVQYAHYGYVYCMALIKGLDRDGPDEDVLISGGGDGTIKLWSLDAEAGGAISEIGVLENGDNSVLTLALDGTFLYSGLLEGDINIWDLDTRQLVRSVKAHRDDVLTISVGGGFIFSGGATGFAKKFNQRYECLSRWQAHEGLILASAVASYNGQRIFVTGGNDDCVAIWNVSDCEPVPVGTPKTSNVVFAKFHGNPSESAHRKKILFYGHYDVIAAENEQKKWIVDPFTLEGINGYLYGRGVSDNKGPVLAALYAVADLVSEQTLDSDIIFLIEGEEECGSRGFEQAIRRNKHIIGDIDWILLANSYWLDDEIPCLTYGLRGVVQATVQVESDHPDLHSGVDGSELLDESLKDLVMLLSKLTGPNGHVQIPGFYDPVLPITEAEEERYVAITNALLHQNPSLGTPETLTASLMSRWRNASLTIHRFKISGPENSTIIPRLASATISIRLVPDQEMSQVREALIKFLEEQFEALQTKNRLSISIDHQADPWLGDPENEIFQTLEEAIMEVWGPIDEGRRNSAPPGRYTAPMRKSTNGKTSLSSPSSASTKPVPATSSTLANGSDHSSIAMASQTSTSPESAIETIEPTMSSSSEPRLRKPLYIREGGTIPSIRFLEKEFGAPAAQLPCGQASDSAHLDNERLRLLNLYKSREIFRRVFRELPKK